MRKGFLIIDHGSRRQASNEQLLEIQKLVSQRHPEIPCVAAHMEIAEPNIEQGVALLLKQNVQHIHVLCYFLSNGRHISEDIPLLVKEALAKHTECTYDIAQALGPHELLAELLIKRSPFSTEAYD